MTEKELSCAREASDALDYAADMLDEAGLEILAQKVRAHRATTDRIRLHELDKIAKEGKK